MPFSPLPPDPFRHKRLQAPKLTVMDAALFKMRYRAPEVLRPWTPMAACPALDIGYFLGRKSASVPSGS